MSDLPDGAVVRDYRAGDALFSIILVRTGRDVRAFENSCPHAHMPLERPDGRVPVIAGALVCAMHGATFDARTGACVGGPAKSGLTPFPVRIEDDAVLAD